MAQPQETPQQQDSVGTMVCGDLNSFRRERQTAYRNYKKGIASDILDQEDWNPAAVFQCGSFTIYYQDIENDTTGSFVGNGFGHHYVGEDRRNTLCAVLNYVESVLDVHPNANPTIHVLESFDSQNPTTSNTAFLGMAESFYSVESGHSFGIDPGIYSSFFLDHIQSGIDPDPDFDIDASLVVNFDKTIYDGDVEFIQYYTINDPLTNTNKYDLFTVLLHEVTHMLGISSAIKEDTVSHNAICENGANSFTLFDWHFGYYGNIGTVPFLGIKLTTGSMASPEINSNINQISNPLRQDSVYLYNTGSPYNHNIYTGSTPSLKGAIMSHLGLYSAAFPKRQQYSPGKYVEFVMEPSLYQQVLKRHWSLPELRLLINLGYNLSPVFAMNTNLSPPFTNAQVVQNSPPYRSDYAGEQTQVSWKWSSPYSWVEFTEVLPADFVLINSNTSQNQYNSTLVMHLSEDPTLVDDDGDDIFVRPEMVFGIRGVSSGGNNHNLLTLSEDGKTFIYTPEPGFYGRAEFGFYLTDGKETGALEVYTIQVERDDAIIYPSDQEMIINGDFEDGIEVKTWEEPDKVYTTHRLVNAQPQLHYGLTGTGGGFLHSRGINILHSLDNWPTYSEDGADNGFGVYGHWSTHCPHSFIYVAPFPSSSIFPNNRYGFAGALLGSLIRPVVESKNYILSFEIGPRLGSVEIGQELSGMTIQFISEPEYNPDIGGFSSEILYTIYPEIVVDQVVNSTQQVPWQQVSIPFKYCGNDSSYTIRFAYDIENGPSSNIDNLSLKLDPDPPILSVDAGPDVIISSCPYGGFDPEVFNPGCDMAYSWTPTTGLSNPNILNPFPNPTETTTYTLTVTDLANGNSASDQVTVYVTDSIDYQDVIYICINSEEIDLMDYVSPQGGTFTGPGLNGSIFDPGSVGYGAYTITYQLNQGCLQPVTFLVAVSGYDSGTASHPNGLHVYPGDANDGGTLSGSSQFLDDLVIHDGATFNLTSSNMVFMENKGIRILPGGRLNITDSQLNQIGCGGPWRGIYVYGNKNYSQSGTDVLMQGRLYIDNSTVENAITGLTNYGSSASNSTDTGGMIYAIYTTFRNCRISAQIQNYLNLVNGTSQPIKTEFINCQFLWNTGFQFVDDVANPMVLLKNVDRVKFQGCGFYNTNIDLFNTPNNHYRKAAIYGYQSSVVMRKGCNGYPPYAMDQNGTCVDGDSPSWVTGLNYGVVLRDGTGSSITGTAFSCYRGLWDFKSRNFRLTQNTFNMLPGNMAPYAGQPDPEGGPMWNIPYGACFETSTGFWIEGNTFNIASGTPSAGLFVRNSGPNYNQIYRNTFSNNQFGLVAYDRNRGPDYYKGLKILCNTYTNNTADNWVLSTTNPPYPDNWGISPYQGAPPIPPFLDGESAGNKFLDQPVVNLYNSLQWVNYYHHQSENVTSMFGVNKILVNIQSQCPSSFGSPLGPLSERQSQAIHMQNRADSLGTVLQNIIDAGNTGTLINEVILADFGDAIELYYDLMQVSPNLSKEVMIEAIQKEYELPAQLLTLILNANPHAAKLSEIQRKLDERAQQLAVDQRALIDQGLELTSHKEDLEAMRSHSECVANTLIDKIVMEVLADTAAADKVQLIENYTVGFETPSRMYLLADLLIKKGDWFGFQAKLDAVGNLPLTDEETAEHIDYQMVYGIQMDLITAGDSVLTASNFQALEDLIFDKPHSGAAALANILLERYSGVEFHEVLVEPDWQAKSHNPGKVKYKIPEITVCKIYPNPTEGILMVEVPSGFDVLHAQIIDGTGRVVFETILDPGITGLATLNLRGHAAGSYLLHILEKKGGLDETHRITISK